MTGPVVVGVDGSPSSLAAVEAAVFEAHLRGVGLRVVHAFIWPAMHVPPSPSPLGPPEGGLRTMVEDMMAEAVEHARAVTPDVEVTHAVVAGEPLTVLEVESRAAGLIVVGSRGSGGFVGVLLGSTAVHLAAHARCPVMVVRGRPDPAGPALVAVDGSSAGRAAMEFAFAEASMRGVELVALHAWSTWTDRGDESHGQGLHPVGDPDRTRDEERALTEAVSVSAGRYPQVVVHRRLVHGRTRPTLIEASAGAQLLVVGARGLGGFAGLLLGSVSQAVLHHAQCPVTVVRAE